MKDLATNTRDKPSQIFAQVVSQCDDNVQALPNILFSAFWPLSYCRNCWLLLCTPQAI
jgi:hypothetical protein